MTTEPTEREPTKLFDKLPTVSTKGVKMKDNVTERGEAEGLAPPDADLAIQLRDLIRNGFMISHSHGPSKDYRVILKFPTLEASSLAHSILLSLGEPEIKASLVKQGLIRATRATVPAEPVAHLCETGRYRPYPRFLCSSCRSSSTDVDIEGGDLSARGLCTALNQAISGAAEICAEMAREATTQAAKYDSPYRELGESDRLTAERYLGMIRAAAQSSATGAYSPANEKED